MTLNTVDPIEADRAHACENGVRPAKSGRRREKERPQNISHMDTPSTPSTPGLYRLAAAAALAGLSPETLAEACIRKDIPVTLEVIGARGLRYVRAAELLAWLRGPQPCGHAEFFN